MWLVCICVSELSREHEDTVRSKHLTDLCGRRGAAEVIQVTGPHPGPRS